jgi:hypothetical protein
MLGTTQATSQSCSTLSLMHHLVTASSPASAAAYLSWLNVGRLRRRSGQGAGWLPAVEPSTFSFSVAEQLAWNDMV